MTFRHRLLLDRMVAVPLCLACDLAARALGKLVRRDHSISPATTRRIFVCKLVGMGSIIQATPMLRALKAQFPHAQLTFITLRANRPLVKRLEYVDETQFVDDRSLLTMLVSTLRMLWTLNRLRGDHFFDLEVYSGFTCLLSLFSLARNRFGFYRHSSLFKLGIYTHLIYFNTRMPVRRLYLQLGCVAGVPPDPADHLGTIQVEQEAREALRTKLQALGFQSGLPFILVNPNASDLLIERRWPQEFMVTAVRMLTERGHRVVLMGAPGEAAYVEQIYRALPAVEADRMCNTAGRLSLPEVFALIDTATCVLTNDTGPMHMAFALARPTVCLFGPVDPAHYGILRSNVVTLYAPVSCSPCVHEIDEPPCHGDNVCMKRLLPEWVVNHVCRLLAGSADEPAARILPLVWKKQSGQPLGLVERHVVQQDPLS